MLCDNLALPFRDASLDAVLSVAVIHHIATAERRVHALRELSRVLRVSGRVIISVWAMEQRQRKFESQDVLIPWHRPPTGSCNGSQEVGVAMVPSTTATSDDDVTHYHAYTQTSDSGNDQRQSSAKLKLSGLRRRNGRGNRKAGRSFDPGANNILEAGGGYRPPYQSSSDLSSPNNETCYSFVRKAIQVSCK
jgi:SAM-dependent methyltransferase